ncbi:MAG: DNA-directed RNA polymerase subunit beta' [Candidatus Vogelbacteria bacterium]|nr:DNA-directed RNA polymerase subunit beta' [Candidatus Vogelbacteria bacterium]
METQLPRRKPDAKLDFNAIGLRLASPERIRDWSYGEVTKPETINYRTGRSERGGLFDERIFGPEKDYECYCGKYRRIRYKDIICERCGVEVTHSIVRRDRMGHIELSSPVAHIWFVRGLPSRLGLLLNLSVADLEKVIYFAGYVVTKVNEAERAAMLKDLDREYKQRAKNLQDERSKESLKESMMGAKKSLETLRAGQVLDEVLYHRLSLKYGAIFEAAIGAEALYQICRSLDLGALLDKITVELDQVGAAERVKTQKRYNLVRSMKRSGIRPEWMFLSAVPVIPPDLRPMVALDGGRHATSDVNDLYRRVINRNNRLKKLQELKAPEVILRNEKRILQEAVDALIDNSIRRASGGAVSQAQRRPLKSLSDGLRGKQGRFRQNLLGKRVDYSGRSVIVIGPELQLSQCGLPKRMALELFRPFIIAQILKSEAAYNIRGAGRLIDDEAPEVWAILEEVIKDKHVFLNRAPTLHRLGIQAFQPILIEGNAIEVHPLVCSAFNADFDGDQMAVHIPLSEPAQREARELIAASKNILKPGNGSLVVTLGRLDIVLGCFWVSKYKLGTKGEGKIFADSNAAIMAYNFGELDLRAKIKVVGDDSAKPGELAGQLFETSVGRILFNRVLPVDLPFVNKEITGKVLNSIVDDLLARYGTAQMVTIVDRVKNFGFKYATKSGVTWGIDEVIVPASKKELIEAARGEVAGIEEKYNEGLLSKEEKSRLDIKVWTAAKSKIEKVLIESLNPEGSVSYMLTSGARGSTGQFGQMGGMKGLIVGPAGNLIDFPIIPSYKEGLSPLEYFITTHGSRKGLTDTALNTAKAGYLTRRLVYVAEDLIIKDEDCGDTDGKLISTARTSGFDRGLAHLIWGRVLARELKTPAGLPAGQAGKILFAKGHLLTQAEAGVVEKHGLTEAQIRTVLTCRSPSGVCQKCYGIDLGRGTSVAVGEPVGIVAAQAIGEPGTQLTMRTKHTGGVDVGMDIVGGLPRVEEIFERRLPKNPAVICQAAGLVIEVRDDPKERLLVVAADAPNVKGRKLGGATKTLVKNDGQTVEYKVPPLRDILVKAGDKVKRGDCLTDGPADLQELFKYAGKNVTEEYIVNEINKIYELQSASISRKHIEVIIRQMFSRRRIKQPGDTAFEIGEVVENSQLLEANEAVKKDGGKEATAEMVLLGVSEVSLNTASFISAVSFAQSTKTLIKTASRGGLDRLRGLKENVIVGRLIPAGTGLKKDYVKLDVLNRRTN